MSLAISCSASAFVPPSPSLKSLGSSRASSPFDITELETPTVQPKDQKHPRYYFKDGNLIFQIEEKIYNVHRYFFERDSSYFHSILETTQGTDVNNPLVLPDLSRGDFDEFLDILYPLDFRRPTEKTTVQWASILHLAAKWGFESIKLLAIDNLTANAVPVDKIVLGRRYGISGWLPGAYEAVCTREDPLTVEEGMKLGVEDIIKISAARQAYGYAKSRFETKYLSQDLGDIFGLEGNSEVQGIAPKDDEVTAIKTLEGEVSDAQAAFLAIPAPPGGVQCDFLFCSGTAYDSGPTCAGCRVRCKPEMEEYILKKVDKEEKERRLKVLTDKRHQRCNVESAAKQERMTLFQY